MRRKGPILIVAGTRPEVIKLAPLYLQLKAESIETLFCATFQHKELLHQALDVFHLVPDLVCSVMKPGQSLAALSSRLLTSMTSHLEKIKPSCVVVQGDTSTAFMAGLSAFYQKIPVIHVEAGLRSYDMLAPFPEEMNRKGLGVVASIHCAPTEKDRQALLKENVPDEHIFCVGNTVVDALRIVLEKIEQGDLVVSPLVRKIVESARKSGQLLVPMTMHRREGFQQDLQGICKILGEFVKTNQKIILVYPRHPNPATNVVADWIKSSGLDERFEVIEALNYTDMVYLMSRSAFIVTDSGGIQEEAVCLGIPAICVREVTERTQGIDIGLVHLVGFDQNIFQHALVQVFKTVDKQKTFRTINFNGPYGDGFASVKIARILQQAF